MEQNKAKSPSPLPIVIGAIVVLVVIGFIAWRAIGESGANTACTGSEVELCLSVSDLEVGFEDVIQLSGETTNIGDQDLEFQASQFCDEGGIMIAGGETFNFNSPICAGGFQGTVPFTVGTVLATRPEFIASEHLSVGENEITLMFDGASVSMTVTVS